MEITPFGSRVKLNSFRVKISKIKWQEPSNHHHSFSIEPLQVDIEVRFIEKPLARIHTHTFILKHIHTLDDQSRWGLQEPDC